MPVTLAFYKSPGNYVDKIIRFFTQSKYSHVEIVHIDASNPCDVIYTGYTSSPRDGGVVVRRIDYNETHWELVTYEFSEEEPAFAFVRKHIGEPYDWMSIFFHHFIRLGIHSREKWTCSEMVASALGIPYAWRHSPGSLHKLIKDLHDEHGYNS